MGSWMFLCELLSPHTHAEEEPDWKEEPKTFWGIWKFHWDPASILGAATCRQLKGLWSVLSASAALEGRVRFLKSEHYCLKLSWILTLLYHFTDEHNNTYLTKQLWGFCEVTHRRCLWSCGHMIGIPVPSPDIHTAQFLTFLRFLLWYPLVREPFSDSP